MDTIDLDSLTLKTGSHSNRSQGVCLMEAVAWMAGEKHSDAPQCACPSLAAFGRSLNDRWKDDERQLLKRFVPLLIGTRSTREVQLARTYMLVDYSIRKILPVVVALSRQDLADRLRELPPITNRQRALDANVFVREVRATLRAAEDEAWKKNAAYAADAAYAAYAAYADDAAAYAAYAAYAAAAYAAAYDAAAYAAAPDAAYDAAYAAARKQIVDLSIEAFDAAIAIKEVM